MPEEIRWVKTHCARMDHGGCGLLVGVKGSNRSGARRPRRLFEQRLYLLQGKSVGGPS